MCTTIASTIFMTFLLNEFWITLTTRKLKEKRDKELKWFFPQLFFNHLNEFKFVSRTIVVNKVTYVFVNAKNTLYPYHIRYTNKLFHLFLFLNTFPLFYFVIRSSKSCVLNLLQSYYPGWKESNSVNLIKSNFVFIM